MVQRKEKMVTVCASCLRASCWQGEFVCQEYMTADTIQKPVKELATGLRAKCCRRNEP